MFALTQKSPLAYVRMYSALIVFSTTCFIEAVGIATRWHYAPWAPGTFWAHAWDGLAPVLAICFLLLATLIPLDVRRFTLSLTEYANGLYVDGIETGRESCEFIHQPVQRWYLRWFYTGLVAGVLGSFVYWI